MEELLNATRAAEEARRYFEEQLAAIETAAISELAELDNQFKALKSRFEKHIQESEGGKLK